VRFHPVHLNRDKAGPETKRYASGTSEKPGQSRVNSLGGVRLAYDIFIRNGSDTPKQLASAWLKCRSLLAGEENMNRLQAGSCKLANERRAWWVVVGLKMPRGLPRGSLLEPKERSRIYHE